NRQAARGMGWLGWVIVGLVVFLGIRLVLALFAGLSGGGRPAGGYGGGYGPGYGGGGGGRLSRMMGGLFGAGAGDGLSHSFLAAAIQAAGTFEGSPCAAAVMAFFPGATPADECDCISISMVAARPDWFHRWSL